jgi:hypothetical protein
MHERNKALRRIYTNKSIVLLVRAKLGQREASYRFVLERLVIMTPSPQTVDRRTRAQSPAGENRVLPEPHGAHLGA